MKRTIRDMTFFVGGVDRRYIRWVLMVLTLILLVLGVGAPEDGGGT